MYEDNFDDIFQFVLLNTSDLSNNNFDSFENNTKEDTVNTTDELLITTTNTDSKTEDSRKVTSHSRRGRPRSKPLTISIVKDRRNVRMTMYWCNCPYCLSIPGSQCSRKKADGSDNKNISETEKNSSKI